MRISSFVSRIFWAEAVLTVVNLINITPLSFLAGKTPHERLYSSPPDYSMLCTFGYTYYVFPPNEHAKLSARSSRCILSIRVIAAVIPWHVVILYSVMSPSLRTLLIFHFHFGKYTFVAA